MSRRTQTPATCSRTPVGGAHVIKTRPSASAHSRSRDLVRRRRLRRRRRATTAPATAPTTAPSTRRPAEAPSTGRGESMAPVTGSISVSGSSTVEPISTARRRGLQGREPRLQLHRRGPRHGRRLQEVLRRRDRHRRRLAQDQGRGGRRLPDGRHRVRRAARSRYDGITVMTSSANTAVTCLSFADLYALIGPESQGFAKWSDAAALAKELGSNTTFPDADLVDHRPRRGVRHVRQLRRTSGRSADRRERASRRPGRRHSPSAPTTRRSPNDNAIIEGIAGSDSSLGWVGFAFAEENKDKVAEIQVAKDANGTCVAPTRRHHHRRQLPAVPHPATST